ncbi:MAG: Ig-like domain-containing protein, partial [Bacillota bacterium]|nr:Ig-like domain-containing protein [Bacillota bacterium]
MLKRIISNLLILCILLFTFTPSAGLDEKSFESLLKSGFSLTPLNKDSTGISTDTSFLLKAMNDISLEKVKSALSIDGEPAPDVIMSDAKRFTITPKRQLLENSIYIIRLKLDTEITWSFQTTQTFRILGTLPGDKSVNVPTDSGIEINFSQEDFDDIDNLFEIAPKVEGRFERHKKTIVFVPKKLEEGTVYTIKIKKGLKLKNTSKSIDEDYVFSFETYKKSDASVSDKTNGFISYIRNVYDYKTESAPVIPLNFYLNESVYKKNSIDVNTKIYAYKSFDSFYDALSQKQTEPYWGIAKRNNFISVTGLDAIQSFTQTLQVKKGDYNANQYMEVPKALPRGYYLVDSYWDDLRFQTFLQITDTCVYLTKSNTKTLVWLNDLSNKSPMEGALVAFSDLGSSGVTDSKGIAYLDTPTKDKNEDYNYKPQYVKITTKEGYISVLDYSSYGSQPSEFYWNYFYTDRSMYQPDDTINFWGFLKNRYKDEEVNGLTVTLDKGYGFNSTQEPLIKKIIDVKDGFYEGEIKLPTLEPGGYNLEIKRDDTLISSMFVKVYNYTKPSYKIDITKDKQAIFPGQQVNFGIKSSFFEGTGVANLKVDYFIDDYFSGIKNGSGTTDTKGNINVKYTPELKNKAQGEQQVRLNIRATLPESGEINQSDYVRVFSNDINVNL